MMQEIFVLLVLLRCFCGNSYLPLESYQHRLPGIGME